ncbi:hypothetical protein KY284_032665 [Solanum tuberosum]|nr:hypothetical protein KY284_032665 [Solanum tuberosum]
MSYVNNEHIVEIKRSHRKRRLNQHQLDCLHFDTFPEWFKEKCDWVDVTKGKGVKDDELGFTFVNFSLQADTVNRECHEPFIFGEQDQQSSMQSDLTSFSLLENSCVREYKCDDWIRSGVYGILIETNLHSQASTNDGEANVVGGNDIENGSDS